MALREFLGFLLVVAIAFTFGSYIFFNLTEHDTGQRFFSKIISERISRQATEEDFASAERDVSYSCKEKGEAKLNITDAQLSINCSGIGKAPFKTIVANLIYDEMIYHKKYNCNFFDCLTNIKSFPALISEQAHNKYHIYYLYLLAIDIILAILLFAVSAGWHSKASAFGYVFLISGLEFFLLFVTNKVLSFEADFMNNVLYAQAAMLFLGIILLILGAILKSRYVKRREEVMEYEES